MNILTHVGGCGNILKSDFRERKEKKVMTCCQGVSRYLRWLSWWLNQAGMLCACFEDEKMKLKARYITCFAFLSK